MKTILPDSAPTWTPSSLLGLLRTTYSRASSQWFATSAEIEFLVTSSLPIALSMSVASTIQVDYASITNLYLVARLRSTLVRALVETWRQHD